jgi:hypothetical protein
MARSGGGQASAAAEAGMAEHPAEALVRQFQDRIVRGTWDGVSRIDPAARDRVLACQGAACAQAFVELFQIPDDLPLDDFLERMRLGGASKVEITRDGDVIRWEELHGGECMCPLVKRGVIALDAHLCRCAVHWLRDLFARRVEGPVHVRLVDAVAHGATNCIFEVTLGQAALAAIAREAGWR